jgi:hypothetical protein
LSFIFYPASQKPSSALHLTDSRSAPSLRLPCAIPAPSWTCFSGRKPIVRVPSRQPQAR